MPDVSIFGWTPTFECSSRSIRSSSSCWRRCCVAVDQTDKADWNPSIPRKFSYGLVGAGVSTFWCSRSTTPPVPTARFLDLADADLSGPYDGRAVPVADRPGDGDQAGTTAETGLAMGGWFLSMRWPTSWPAHRCGASAAAKWPPPVPRWRSTAHLQHAVPSGHRICGGVLPGFAADQPPDARREVRRNGVPVAPDAANNNGAFRRRCCIWQWKRNVVPAVSLRASVVSGRA